MAPIEFKVWMFVTSKDLEQMADKARKIEQNSVPGDSCVIQDWYCGEGVIVHLVVDQDRAMGLKKRAG